MGQWRGLGQAWLLGGSCPQRQSSSGGTESAGRVVHATPATACVGGWSRRAGYVLPAELRARVRGRPRAPKRRTRCDSGCPRLAKTHAKNRLNTRLRRRSASAAALAAAGPSTGSTDLLRMGGCRQRRHGPPCGRAALLAYEYAIRPHFTPTTYEASAPGDTDFGDGYVARSGPSYRCRC